MGSSFRRSHSYTAALSALDPAAAHCQPTAVPETPVHSQASLGQSLVGSLLLSPGSWCTQGFVCALQDSVSPVLCKFYNQIPLASKVKFPGVLSLFARSPGWELFVGPGTFLTLHEFLWCNCSAVCGSSAWWLFGGVNGNLLQEGLCHTQVCCTQRPYPATGHR